ncbi:MAG: exo-alpha-sialidase [Actinobacteria bacterium]|nr:exo-alpha-sialidase [Actinomycetota bacterium]
MKMTLLVGTRKGLFSIERDRDRWQIDTVDFLGESVTAAVVGRDGATYAALGTGHFGSHIWRREPGGQFAEVGAPTYPERPADATDVSPMTQQPWPWTVQMLWTLENGPAERPDELWCGTVPGGLFRSSDRGGSWELVRSLWDMPERTQWFGGGYDWPGIHSISIDPRRPDTLLIGISCGGAWITEDAGATWSATRGMRNEYMPPGEEYTTIVQDPHRLARCAAAPDIVWNQHHNGCFRSADGGRNWTEITERPPSVFGFAVAAHPSNPQTAWFAPAIKDEMRVPVDGRLVVSRTTDGGASFEVFGDGLPHEHSYDLIYRHSLDVDSTGDVLAMGSTTGSLWISEDGGEQWTTVSNNLPPVHFTRFVA